MSYRRCDNCHVREVGLWPCFLPGSSRRVYLCGACAETLETTLSDARPLWGAEPTPEQAQANREALRALQEDWKTRSREIKRQAAERRAQKLWEDRKGLQHEGEPTLW